MNYKSIRVKVQNFFVNKPYIRFRYAVLVMIALSILCFRYFDNIRSFLFPQEVTVANSANFETIKFLVYIIGGCLLVWQIMLTNRRTKASEQAAFASFENIRIIEKGQVQERFKNAIDQLGSVSEAVNLGAIYTLHHIAKESIELRKSIFDILCSYIRETTSNQEYQLKEAPSIKIQSILNLLFNDERERDIYSLFNADLHNAYLLKADLSSAHLPQANLNKADLVCAVCINANLEGATLIGAILQGAILQEANLKEADLQDAGLQDSTFKGANLKGAILDGAILNGANLQKANLEDAFLVLSILKGTTFEGANLKAADFDGAIYERTNFSGANLNSAKVESLQWIKILKETGCIGVEDIEEKYYISEEQKDNETISILKEIPISEPSVNNK